MVVAVAEFRCVGPHQGWEPGPPERGMVTAQQVREVHLHAKEDLQTNDMQVLTVGICSPEQWPDQSIGVAICENGEKVSGIGNGNGKSFWQSLRSGILRTVSHHFEDVDHLNLEAAFREVFLHELCAAHDVLFFAVEADEYHGWGIAQCRQRTGTSQGDGHRACVTDSVLPIFARDA